MKKSVDFDWNQIEVMLDMIDIPVTDDFTYSKLASGLNVSMTDPHYREVVSFLKKKRIIIEKKMIGPSKIIDINKTKLIKILPDLDIPRQLHERLIVKAWGIKSLWTYS